MDPFQGFFFGSILPALLIFIVAVMARLARLGKRRDRDRLGWLIPVGMGLAASMPWWMRGMSSPEFFSEMGDFWAWPSQWLPGEPMPHLIWVAAAAGLVGGIGMAMSRPDWLRSPQHDPEASRNGMSEAEGSGASPLLMGPLWLAVGAIAPLVVYRTLLLNQFGESWGWVLIAILILGFALAGHAVDRLAAMLPGWWVGVLLWVLGVAGMFTAIISGSVTVGWAVRIVVALGGVLVLVGLVDWRRRFDHGIAATWLAMFFAVMPAVFLLSFHRADPIFLGLTGEWLVGIAVTILVLAPVPIWLTGLLVRSRPAWQRCLVTLVMMVLVAGLGVGSAVLASPELAEYFNNNPNPQEPEYEVDNPYW